VRALGQKPLATSQSPARLLYAIRVEQPGVDDKPFVAPLCPEVEERRSRILQFKKELQGVSPGCFTGCDPLFFDPLVPFLDHQTLRLFLLHNSSPDLQFETRAQFKQKDFKTVFRDDESGGYLHRYGAAADLLDKTPISGGLDCAYFSTLAPQRFTPAGFPFKGHHASNLVWSSNSNREMGA
jgi:hypothetical protein